MGRQAKIKQQRKSERSPEEVKTKENPNTQETPNTQAWMPSWLKKRFPNLNISFVELIIWAAIFGITSAVVLKTFI